MGKARLGASRWGVAVGIALGTLAIWGVVLLFSHVLAPRNPPPLPPTEEPTATDTSAASLPPDVTPVEFGLAGTRDGTAPRPGRRPSDGGEGALPDRGEHRAEVIAPPVQPPPGDLNADGLVTVQDLILLRRAIQEAPQDEVVSARADLDGDGVISDSDLAELKRLIVSSEKE